MGSCGVQSARLRPRARRLLGALIVVAASVLGLERTLDYLLRHDEAIHRTAAGLQTWSEGRDRPATLPFQRLSETRLWENVPSYTVPGTDPPYRLINSLGCRGPELIEPKPANRILCLGDSSTFGLGVGDQETYSARLQSLLRERTGKPVEAVNGGVVGYTVLQGIIQLREIGPSIRPDVVVAAFGYNERWHHRTGDAAALAARQRRAWMRPFLQSEAFLLLRHAILSMAPRGGVGPAERLRPRVSVSEFERGLRDLCSEARSLGSRCALLVLHENPRTYDSIGAAEALLEQGDAAGALRLLEPIAQTPLHRYPLADELLRRARRELQIEAADPAAPEADAVGQSNWGRAYLQAEYLDAADRVAIELGVPIVHFAPPSPWARYKDDIHPSQQGHEWIAERLAESLLARRWLEGPGSGRATKADLNRTGR